MRKVKICSCPFKDIKNYRYCGSEVIESDICFVPGVTKEQIEKAEISFEEPDARDFKIELVCCNFIVVCGLITKKIKYKKWPKHLTADVDEELLGKKEIIARKDIPVQIKIPVNIDNPEYLDIDKWEIVGAEICSNGCTNLTCPLVKDYDRPRAAEEEIDNAGHKPPVGPHPSFRKLVEKDIVSVLIQSKEKHHC